MEKNYSGLDKLRKYLMTVESKDLLSVENTRPFISMEWLYSENLSTNVVNKTIARIMQNNNPNYNARSRHKYEQNFSKYKSNGLYTKISPTDKVMEYVVKSAPNNIEGFSMFETTEGCVLQFLGADNWTRLDLYDSLPSNYNSIVPALSLEDFEIELLKTLQIDMDNPDQRKLAENSVHTGLNEMFSNTAEYYKYLLKIKEEHSKHTCVVDPDDLSKPISRSAREKDLSNNTAERTSNLLSLQERRNFLEQLNPIERISVVNSKGVPTHITYMYKDPLKQINQTQNGFLFISEPLDSDKMTRLFYISEDEFNFFAVDKNTDRISKIVESFMKVPTIEYSGPQRVLLNHTLKSTTARSKNSNENNLSTYFERLSFFLNGQNSAMVKRNTDYYIQRLRNLYSSNKIELPYYKPRKNLTIHELADIAASGKKGSVDRSAQNFVFKNYNDRTNDQIERRH